MQDTALKSRKLQVANAKPQDSGHGIARLSKAVFAELGLNEGDVVLLEGKRQTAARAVQTYPEDEGLELVRLDSLLRINAGVATGEPVTIAKASTANPTETKRTFRTRPLMTPDLASWDARCSC